MDHTHLLHSLFMLAIAIVSIAMFKRLGIPLILAYLFTGLVSGPAGFDWFNQEQIYLVAELGIVLLMFSLGLEFSWPKMWAMRKKVFGIGLGQVVLTWLAVWVLGAWFGLTATQALVIGVAVALSSSAIVLKLINEQNWLHQRHGEISTSVLLFQDLAVVPFLIILSLLEQHETLSWFFVMSTTLSATMAVAALMFLGHWILPWLFDEVARAKTHELFVLTTLGVALLTGVLTHELGFSMALGAFMAGMLLAESQYKAQIEADIRPFRDILLGVFFISIGMLLDVHLIADHFALILLMLLAVISLKVAIVLVLLKIVKESAQSMVASALCLAQMGEFSFVVLSLGSQYQLIPTEYAQLFIMVAVCSMALAPYLVQSAANIALKVSSKVVKKSQINQEINLPEKDVVLLLGYGRVGQTIARFLKMENLSFVAIDLDPIRVREAQSAGEPVFFGDVQHRAILKQAGVRQARLVVITFNQKRGVESLITLVKRLAPRSHVMVRTEDDSQLELLEKAGAQQVIPEILEGSLMLVSQVLHQCNVPLSRIVKRTAAERRHRYKDLHHFFAASELTDEDAYIHAVHLEDGSFITGLTLQELALKDWDVQIKAVRRAGEEIENPPHDLLLNAGDIILLLGKPHSVELAEHYMHIG